MPKPNKKERPNPLGVLLSKARAKSGLSLAQLSKNSGMSISTLWELERGRTCNPRIQTLYTLARALGIPFVKLTRAAEEMLAAE